MSDRQSDMTSKGLVDIGKCGMFIITQSDSQGEAGTEVGSNVLKLANLSDKPRQFKSHMILSPVLLIIIFWELFMLLSRPS